MSTGEFDVSLVVPCRDVAPYLPALLDSLRAQRVLPRTQVLLVDDGSSDGTRALLDEFAGRHPQARVVAGQHAGPGAARNRALALVRAPWVAFADADDTLVEGGLDALLDSARGHAADLVVADFVNVPERPYGRWKRHFGGGDAVLTGLTRHPDLLFSGSVWNKLFSRRVLERAGGRFPEGVVFEDAYVSIAALLAADRVALLDRPVYRYTQRPDGSSIMDSLRDRPENYRDHLDLNLRLLSLGERYGPGTTRLVQRYAAFTYLGFLRRLADPPPGLDVAALLPDIRRLYGLIPDEVAREFVLSRRDEALQRAARAGTLAPQPPQPPRPHRAGPARGPERHGCAWRELPLNPAVRGYAAAPRLRVCDGRVELAGEVTAADGLGFGARRTATSVPLTGVLPLEQCPDGWARAFVPCDAPGAAGAAAGTTLGVVRISRDGVLRLALPRLDAPAALGPLPVRVDLSAVSWKVSAPPREDAGGADGGKGAAGSAGAAGDVS